MPIPELNPKLPVFLVLYSRLSGYFYDCLTQFALDSGCQILAVRQDTDPLSPFQLPEVKNIFLVNRTSVSLSDCQTLISSHQILALYSSGWVDPMYRKVGKMLKTRGVPTILGMDNQWFGTRRQQVATVISRWYLHPSFSHIWIPGLFQYEYARRLGFDRKKILTGLYSANVSRFLTDEPGKNMAKRFVYTGRLIRIKGADLLARAADQLATEYEHPWPIQIYGSGPVEEELKDVPGILHTPFLQPEKLREEIKKGGVLILPSRKEAWGVVLHEFAAAGYPILVSEAVGGRAGFVKPGYNGYYFPTENVDAMVETMKRCMNHSSEQLALMGQRSRDLALSITPQSWSALLCETLRI